MPKKLMFLLSLIAYLNVLDLYTTHILLSLGGRELNVVWKHFNETGIGTTDVILKLLIPCVAIVILWLCWRDAKKRNSKLAVYVIYGLIIFLNVFFIYIVAHNTRMMVAQLEEVRRVIG